MNVILSEAKNLTYEGQMLRLRLSMTTHQVICDKAIKTQPLCIGGRRTGYFIISSSRESSHELRATNHLLKKICVRQYLFCKP